MKKSFLQDASIVRGMKRGGLGRLKGAGGRSKKRGGGGDNS